MSLGSFMRRMVIAAGVLTAATAFAQSSALDAREIVFDVPRQPLETALLVYAEQAQVQLVVASGTVDRPQMAGLQGRYPARRALELLLRDTGLMFEIASPETIVIYGLKPDG
ncbi:MAG: hypothetical protein JWQ90_2473 [Hydrocarboniphaga sp.]|uniref:STN domain-containing protein n=1 Tax=Hydrocarboniphaga sp. TaxID=2033016 RepID=UPI0026060C94|nr:STN domain-containing protein [Hydrocarboniphaga sp.]MDB5970023.1 hypothetical protein [Hydrocarboniphaga sp.]